MVGDGRRHPLTAPTPKLTDVATVPPRRAVRPFATLRRRYSRAGPAKNAPGSRTGFSEFTSACLRLTTIIDVKFGPAHFIVGSDQSFRLTRFVSLSLQDASISSTKRGGQADERTMAATSLSSAPPRVAAKVSFLFLQFTVWIASSPFLLDS
jgi:hypothetical protein